MVIGCLSSSIFFGYETSRGHLFVMSWAMVRQVAGVVCVVECCLFLVSGCCLLCSDVV